MKNTLKVFFLLFTVLLYTACTKKDHNASDTNEILSQKNEILSQKIEEEQLETLKKNNVIYFDLDKYNIHTSYEKTLSDYADFLRQNNSYKIIIEGHTDERGTPEYNIALGERRANAIKTYLQTQGVSSNQISIVSYGEEKPEALGHNEEAYAKNRRVVLLYLNEK